MACDKAQFDYSLAVYLRTNGYIQTLKAFLTESSHLCGKKVDDFEFASFNDNYDNLAVFLDKKSGSFRVLVQAIHEMESAVASMKSGLRLTDQGQSGTVSMQQRHDSPVPDRDILDEALKLCSVIPSDCGKQTWESSVQDPFAAIWSNTDDNAEGEGGPVSGELGAFVTNASAKGNWQQDQLFDGQPVTIVNLGNESGLTNPSLPPKSQQQSAATETPKLIQSQCVSSQATKQITKPTSTKKKEQMISTSNKGQKRAPCFCPNCEGNKGLPVEQRKQGHQCNAADCKKTFVRVSHLRAHQRSHIGDRPFHCDFAQCDKKFFRSDQLQRHKSTHTGLKPFRCDICSKEFTRKDQLDRHQQTHGGK